MVAWHVMKISVLKSFELFFQLLQGNHDCSISPVHLRLFRQSFIGYWNAMMNLNITKPVYFSLVIGANTNP